MRSLLLLCYVTAKDMLYAPRELEHHSHVVGA